MSTPRTLALCLALCTLAPAALAQWNPNAGQWGKTDARDLRVMTWNIQDSLCSTESKVEAGNDWSALARTVALLKPDVLLMQECGDNSGNGTGASIDSVATLTTVLELFMHGGADPFLGGTVTSYVQKYAPGYDLPYIYVSSTNDAFNRNVLLSRYPITDLNGDGKAALDNATILADLYAPGGNFGIRGFIFAEINLPDSLYRGDLVAGSGHLRSGGAASDLAERLTSGKNIAYYIDYLFNGGGGSTPDPRNRINDLPAATSVLSPYSAVIWGGDMNEDEDTNGRKGPVEWMTMANTTGGTTDGTDKDRTDCLFDTSVDFFSGTRVTQNSGSKLDYLMWQDSVATLRRSYSFYSSGIPSNAVPAEFVGWAGTFYTTISSVASDHRAVFADYVLPIALPGAFSLSLPADGAFDLPTTPTLSWTASTNAASYTLKVATDPTLTSVVTTVSGLTSTSYVIPPELLTLCGNYYWSVTATNASGNTVASTSPFFFATHIFADVTHDGLVDLADFFEFLNCFDQTLPCGDANGDSEVDLADFFEFLNAFDGTTGCP
jgi:endonuclease/exonuclease/phosphatase family metal-dependent hydrolase